MTDQGTEFLNQHFRALMQKEDIELYNTYNETKASIMERLIHTLKTKMWRYFTAKKNMRYIDTLPDLVYSYNFSIHRIALKLDQLMLLQKKRKENLAYFV